MSDAWNTRLKATWRGEVPNADLTAMFAATAGLSALQQALEDLRLSTELDQAGNAWRTLLAVGRIAAPLWLADALVGLAGIFYDTESQAHPNRSASLSPAIHDLVAALLAPVEDIIADVTAALADPGHRTALVAPLRVGPGGDIARHALPDPATVSYVRGLSAGAARVHTAAAVALAAAKAALAPPPAPDWLARGIQRIDGELQAARARLDMSDVHVASLVGTHSDDAAALAQIARDLWLIVGTSIAAGQMLTDPHLLPEAAAAAAASPDIGAARVWTAAPPAAPPRQPTHAPLPPPTLERPVALPRIDPGAAPLRERRDAHGPPSALPHPTQPPAEVTLPAIGAPAPSPPPAEREAPTPAHQPQPPSPDAPATGTDAGSPIRFPDIG